MYDSLKRELSFNACFLNWPKYQNEMSYREVAERIIAEHHIDKQDIIGGSSLGGMIALEVATVLDANAVVLMGSALNRSEINWPLSIMSPLASITPFSFIQALSGKNDQIVSQMFAESDPEFIRSMCKYMPSWPGYHGRNDKVYRIHGQKDHIINCPRLNCEVVKGAGHLIAITHATECAEFLECTNSHLTRFCT